MKKLVSIFAVGACLLGPLVSNCSATVYNYSLEGTLGLSLAPAAAGNTYNVTTALNAILAYDTVSSEITLHGSHAAGNLHLPGNAATVGTFSAGNVDFTWTGATTRNVGTNYVFVPKTGNASTNGSGNGLIDGNVQFNGGIQQDIPEETNVKAWTPDATRFPTEYASYQPLTSFLTANYGPNAGFYLLFGNFANLNTSSAFLSAWAMTQSFPLQIGGAGLQNYTAAYDFHGAIRYLPPSQVPEPGSMLLLLSGLGGLGMRTLRKGSAMLS